MASKVLPDFAYTDLLLDTAGWKDTMVSHADFINNSSQNLCPLFKLHGFNITRAMRDPMHGVNLGIAQHMCGNVLYEMVTRDCVLVKNYNIWLEAFWHRHKAWCREHHFGSTIGQFTLANLNKPDNKVKAYPLLHCKAANCRYLLTHLAELLRDESEALPNDKHWKSVATMAYFMVDFSMSWSPIPAT
jgi:hypothetical protein